MGEINKKEVGQRIRGIRASLGETAEKFGERFDPEANRGLVSAWENGRYLPNMTRLKTIADIAGITVDELLHGPLESFMRRTFDEEMQRMYERENVSVPVPPKIRDVWLEKFTHDYLHNAEPVDYETVREDVVAMMSAYSDFLYFSEEEAIIAVETYIEAILDILDYPTESKKEDRWEEIKKLSLEIKDTIEEIK